MDKFNVASIQMNCILYDVDSNLKTASTLIEKAVEKNARIIALPELFNTGYHVADEDLRLSEPVPGGHTTKWMESLCRKYNIYICGAIIEKDQLKGVLYDTAVLAGPDGYIGKYRKVFLWDKENLRFKHGNDYPVFDLGFVKIGMQICYEAGFPEGARLLALNGADLLIYMAAFGKARSYVWELATRARALENGIFVLASNMTGQEDGNPMFASESRIIDPRGDVMADSPEEISVLVEEIDLERIALQRRTVPYMRDYNRPLIASKFSQY